MNIITKVVIITQICLLTARIAESQTPSYKHFGTGFAAWGYIMNGNDPGCINNICDTERVVQVGIDTVIGNNSYHQLFKDLVYNGGLREDTITRSIFYIPKNSNIELLLYNFNLNIGDTIHSWLYDSLCFSPITVVNIDSTDQYSVDFRRVYRLSNNIDWIEGIGSSAGLLVGCNGVNFAWNLVCYKEDSTVVYSIPNPIINCSLINTFKNITNDHFQVFPTILRNGSYLNVNRTNFNGDLNVEIRNIAGSQMKIFYLNFNEDQIFIQDLLPGTFLLRISNREGINGIFRFLIMP